MPRKLPEEVAEALKECGLGPDACWDCHGTWVVYHWALEKVAVAKGIYFETPVVLEANGPEKCVALSVTGNNGETTHWSVGEAAPQNNKNAYPYAMAEKRAKDRVILKFLGLHGLVYSEEEADSFKRPDKQTKSDQPEKPTDGPTKPKETPTEKPAVHVAEDSYKITTSGYKDKDAAARKIANKFSEIAERVPDLTELKKLQEDNMEALEWVDSLGWYDPVQVSIDKAHQRLAPQAAE